METMYFVIIYATYNDGKAPKKAIYDAKDHQDAINQFHGYMSTYGKDMTVAHALVQAQDSNGVLIRQEIYDKPVVEQVVEEPVAEEYVVEE